jgi:hypothetical protein
MALPTQAPYPGAPDFTPPQAAPAPDMAAAPAPAMSNGLMQVQSASQLEAQSRAQALARQAQPHISGLATHIRHCWSSAKTAKREPEQRMMRSLRARDGIYEADKLAAIRQQGGSEIYMMLTATKCRAAAALLRDLLLGNGTDKPWSIAPTSIPDLPEDKLMEAKEEATNIVMQQYMMGPPPTPADVRAIAEQVKGRYMNEVREEAKEAVGRMEDKMEDQLQEGGFLQALSAFIDDLAVFPSAIMKGPVIRKKFKMAYAGGAVTVVEDLVTEWERVDPTRFYPAPHSEDIQDGYCLEHHSMTIQSLTELKGVEGYDNDSIDAVIEDYGRGGLHEWLAIDSDKARVNEKQSVFNNNPEALIDALQFWGAVPGRMLVDWGIDKAEVPDLNKMYFVEAWLIGSYVIKATLNPHPLGHKPYFKTSYEKIPGRFWGNSPADLVADCQAMCNAAARAIANNMGIASGPQVWIDVSRLPAGEDVTQMFPWKIWQVDRDPNSGAGAPMGFFQPNNYSSELMAIYEKFAMLADEYSGIPRYMTGTEGTGGAGRTASGLSMMIGNAAKTLKQVLSNVDIDILRPLLESLYFHNLRYGQDPDLIGDINVVARGALSLQVKDSAAMNRNQFLQATANPVDLQIIGLPGRAAILREQAKTLGINPDDVVPPDEAIKRMAQVMAFQQMQQQQAMAAQAEQQQMQQQGKIKPGERLLDGTPTTDHFSPQPQQ